MIKCVITGQEFENQDLPEEENLLFLSKMGLEVLENFFENTEDDGVFFNADPTRFINRTVLHEEEKTPLLVGVEKDQSGLRKFTPATLYKYLNEYVMGQDYAKKVISVAVFNHYLRIQKENTNFSLAGKTKSNVLLIGPSGSGKTFLVEKIAEFLDVPIAFADATTLTRAGYVGEDVESLIQQLYQRSDKDISKTERGIIFIDEFDKIKSTSENSHNLDVGGREVQHALLKLLEGSIVKVNIGGFNKSDIRGNDEKIDTSKILFICSGAFVGLDKIIEKRSNPTKQSIGFTALSVDKNKKVENPFQHITPRDLISFGFIPEVVGRIPVIAGLNEHSEESLVRIMTETKDNVTQQYAQLFSAFNVSLHFSEEALKKAAKIAMSRNVGARGLKSIFELSLLDAMFKAPSNSKIKSVLVLEDSIAEITNEGRTALVLTDKVDEKLFFKESKGVKLEGKKSLQKEQICLMLAKQIEADNKKNNKLPNKTSARDNEKAEKKKATPAKKLVKKSTK